MFIDIKLDIDVVAKLRPNTKLKIININDSLIKRGYKNGDNEDGRQVVAGSFAHRFVVSNQCIPFKRITNIHINRKDKL